MADKETRDRVRELVKQVLATVPTEGETEKPAAAPAGAAAVEHVVVNSLQEKLGREWDRDESAKSLITEDDLRGLEAGSRIRVAENAKFTSLAEDIVNERNIQLIRKKPRQNMTKVRSVAIGSDHGGVKMKEQLKSYLTDLRLDIPGLWNGSEDGGGFSRFCHPVAR